MEKLKLIVPKLGLVLGLCLTFFFLWHWPLVVNVIEPAIIKIAPKQLGISVPSKPVGPDTFYFPRLGIQAPSNKRRQQPHRFIVVIGI